MLVFNHWDPQVCMPLIACEKHKRAVHDVPDCDVWMTCPAPQVIGLGMNEALRLGTLGFFEVGFIHTAHRRTHPDQLF